MRHPRHLGPFLVGILTTPLLLNGAAQPERKSWVFEQLSQPPLASKIDEARRQLSVSMVNYADTLSGQISLLMGVKFLEARIKASQRVFFALSEAGITTKEFLSDEKQTLSFELARYFVSPKNYFGRLGLEYVHFFPNHRRWLKAGFGTGILDNVSLPWQLQLNTAIFLPLVNESSFFSLSLETRRVFTFASKTSLRLGGSFSWSERMRDVLIPSRYEHRVISIGPTAELKGLVIGTVRVLAAFRIWIDKELFLKDGKLVAGHPSDFRPPDIFFEWAIAL